MATKKKRAKKMTFDEWDSLPKIPEKPIQVKEERKTLAEWNKGAGGGGDIPTGYKRRMWRKGEKEKLRRESRQTAHIY